MLEPIRGILAALLRREPRGGRPRPLFACAVALLALAVLAGGARGQVTVTGTVSDGETGAPLAHVLVSGLDDEEREVVRTLTDRGGHYTLEVPESELSRVSARMLGYGSVTSDPVTGDPDPVQVDLELVSSPITLDPIDVSVAAVQACSGLDDEEHRLLNEIWSQTQHALDVVAFTAEDGDYRFRREKRERAVSIFTGTEADVGRRTDTSSQPFRSVPPDELLEEGWVRPVEGMDAYDYFAPDAIVVTSREFREAYCFRIQEDGSDPSRVGLAFEPLSAGGPPAIQGTLWVDTETAAPLELEFHYTHHYHEPAIPRAFLPFFGGEVTFRETDAGLWVVDDWVIRMPQYRVTFAESSGLPGGTLPDLVAPYRDVADALPTSWLQTAWQAGFAVWEQGGRVVEVDRRGR